ncbi:uncharacterized protein LOC113943161 [Corapipo altera]|uniref:uncharacterized protein LOC113943161 n=1 Tax=Corapipo altera TaxID=415028 RepID=UPI000FD663C7|nr:uncharacterized protein LOC113943161 [Corapipo altera]
MEGCLAYPYQNQQLLTLYWGLACVYRGKQTEAPRLPRRRPLWEGSDKLAQASRHVARSWQQWPLRRGGQGQGRGRGRRDRPCSSPPGPPHEQLVLEPILPAKPSRLSWCGPAASPPWAGVAGPRDAGAPWPRPGRQSRPAAPGLAPREAHDGADGCMREDSHPWEPTQYGVGSCRRSVARGERSPGWSRLLPDDRDRCKHQIMASSAGTPPSWQSHGCSLMFPHREGPLYLQDVGKAVRSTTCTLFELIRNSFSVDVGSEYRLDYPLDCSSGFWGSG